MLSEPDAADCQQLIQGLWAESLGRPSIAPEDNFFECGGHSLLALIANGRLEHLLQVDIPLRTIFDHPVLADFAVAVAGLMAEQDEADGDGLDGRLAPEALREQP
jgi:hypothetical protein